MIIAGTRTFLVEEKRTSSSSLLTSGWIELARPSETATRYGSGGGWRLNAKLEVLYSVWLALWSVQYLIENPARATEKGLIGALACDNAGEDELQGHVIVRIVSLIGPGFSAFMRWIMLLSDTFTQPRRDPFTCRNQATYTFTAIFAPQKVTMDSWPS